MAAFDIGHMTLQGLDDDIFRFLTENSSDIITLHAPDTHILYVSPIVKMLLGYEPEQWRGVSPLAYIHPEEHEMLTQRFREVFQGRDRSDIVTFVYRIRRRDKTYIWMESTARSLHREDGTLEGFITVTRDISERKKVEEQLRRTNERLQQLSVVDSLTGISNRRYFDDFIRTEWSRGLRNHYPIGLLLFDVDYFKRYNDHYGHPQGDVCLKKIASKTLETFPRSTDVVARYGGEEFAVVLPNTPMDMCAKLAERLRANIESLCLPHAKSETSPYVTLSIGVALLSPTFDTGPELLIGQADQALYVSKQEGRNRVSFYAGVGSGG